MSRRGKLLLHVWLQVALWCGVVFVANHISSAWFLRWDLTAEQRFTLSAESLSIVRRIDRPLLARVYFTGDLAYPFNNHRQALVEKLEELRAWSGGLMEIQVIDPTGDPDASAEAAEYGIRPVPYRFQSRDKFEAKEVFLGVTLLYGDQQRALNPMNNVDLFEYELVRAIHGLTTEAESRKTIGFLQGHGEPDFAAFPDSHPLGKLRDDLAQRYNLRQVTLGADEGVPDEVDALLVLGPQGRVSDRAQYQIDQFLMDGGSLAFFVSSWRPDFQRNRSVELRHDLNALLGHYGIKLNKNAIVDRVNNQVYRAPVNTGGQRRLVDVNYPLMPKTAAWSETSPITKNLSTAVVPFASSVDLAEELPTGVTGEILLDTSDDATSVQSLRYIQADVFKVRGPTELDGPFPLGVALKGRFQSFFADRDIPPIPGVAGNPDEGTDKLLDGAMARMVVVGSMDFPANNADFLANSVDWLVQDVALVNIRTRAARAAVFDAPDRGTAMALKVFTLGLPLFGVGLAGLVVLLVQRRRG